MLGLSTPVRPARMLGASDAERQVEILGIDRLEAALAAAAASFVRASRATRQRGAAGPAHRLLAAQLRLPLADLDRLALAEAPTDVPPALLAHLKDRLERERRRLGRLARAGSARYDLGRHLAVREALRWMSGGSGETPAAEERLSGAVLNGRFRRLGGRSPRAGAAQDATVRAPQASAAPLLAPRSSENCIMKRGRSENGIGMAKW